MNWKYENNRIYSEDENGDVLAEANFHLKENGEIDIEHVYVNPKLRGQGVGGETMTTVAEYLRKEGKKATASCSYANSWFRKNQKNYEDIIANDLTDQVIACNITGRH
jgi:predicted GNAT family acetyltransferase